jgi:hypothetical protein
MTNKDFGVLTAYLGAVRLNGEQAYITSRILESLISALWRTHGNAMADFQGRAFPDDGCYYSSRYGPYPDDVSEPPPDDDDCGSEEIPF